MATDGKKKRTRKGGKKIKILEGPDWRLDEDEIGLAGLFPDLPELFSKKIFANFFEKNKINSIFYFEEK